jgi:RNA polymerase sigma factor (sigma-70 family)
LVSDREWFRSVYDSLRRLAAVVAPREVDPDDLVQEALMQALRRGPLQELDDPLAYLRRTVVNLASNQRRSLGRRRRALERLASAVDDVEADPMTVDTDLLEHIGVDGRASLYLREVEGWSHREIASMLGISEVAARRRFSRALRQLRGLHDVRTEVSP